LRCLFLPLKEKGLAGGRRKPASPLLNFKENALKLNCFYPGVNGVSAKLHTQHPAREARLISMACTRRGVMGWNTQTGIEARLMMANAAHA
jgi:hypothetical protein